MGDRKHDIEKYLRGELSGEEMHALEREALNDPFLAEALEGIEQAGPDNFLYDLHSIRRSVHDRLRSSTRKKNKLIRVWAWTGAIAATLLLIAVSGFIVLSLIREQAARQQAMNAEPEPMPAEFFKKDTLVIALPAQSAIKQKVDGGLTRAVAPTSVETLSQSAPLVAEPERETSDRIVSEEESPIAKASRDQTNDNQTEAATESIAKAESAESARQESMVRKREGPNRAVAGAEAPPSAENTMVLRGKVVDAAGEALPGVNVIVKDANIETNTNADGQFEVRVPPGYSDLMFAFIGFESQEVRIDGRQEVNVTLNEDVTSLSEVVVVSGYGSTYGKTAEHSTFRSAEPIGGKSDFKKFLESAVKYPAEAVTSKVEGRVTVRFTIEKDGQLTNFEVIKGIGSGAEEALINAIKAGPAWKPAMQGDKPIADKAKVKYQFKLPK